MKKTNPEVMQKIILGQLCAATQKVDLRIEIEKIGRKKFKVSYGWFLSDTDTPITTTLSETTITADGSVTLRPMEEPYRPFLLTDVMSFWSEA